MKTNNNVRSAEDRRRKYRTHYRIGYFQTRKDSNVNLQRRPGLGVRGNLDGVLFATRIRDCHCLAGGDVGGDFESKFLLPLPEDWVTGCGNDALEPEDGAPLMPPSFRRRAMADWTSQPVASRAFLDFVSSKPIPTHCMMASF